MRNFSWKDRAQGSLFCLFGVILSFALAILLPDYVFFLKCLMLMLSIAFFIILIVLVVGSIVEQLSNNIHNRQVMFSAENVEKWAVVDEEQQNSSQEIEDEDVMLTGLEVDQRIEEAKTTTISMDDNTPKTALDEHYLQLLQSVSLQEKIVDSMPTSYRGNKKD